MKDHDFIRNLIQRRRSLGLTQYKLDLASGFCKGSVGYYESGKRKPGLDAIKCLCKGLGCKPNDLIDVNFGAAR